MARKRDRSKRKDYRKGGRVKYALGGRPSRRDYSSGDEYEIALEQWKNTKKLGSTTAKMPVRTSGPAKRFPTPAPTPAPVKAKPKPTPKKVTPVRPFDPVDRDMVDSGSMSAYPTVQGSITPVATRPRTAGDFEQYGPAGGYPQELIDTMPELYGSTVFKPTPVTISKQQGISNPDAINLSSKTKEIEAAKKLLLGLGKPLSEVTMKDMKEIGDNISFADIKDGTVNYIKKGIEFFKGLGVDTSDPSKVVTLLLDDKDGEKNRYLRVNKGSKEAKEVAQVFMDEKEERAKESSSSVLQAMPTKFSGVGAGLSNRAIISNYNKSVAAAEAAGEPTPPKSPEVEEAEEEEAAAGGDFGMGRESDLASAMQVLYGGSVGSGMSARGDAWRSEDGGDAVDMAYGENVGSVPQDPDAARKWENKRREIAGLDTDVDGNPLPLGTKHYREAQRALNNLGRQPTAEETQNWLHATYPEAYKATLIEKGVDTTNYVHTPFDAETNPIPVGGTAQYYEDIGGGQDTDGTDGTGGTGGVGASGDNLSRQRAIDIVEGTAQGPQIPPPAQAGYQRDAQGNLVLDQAGQPIPVGITPQQDIQTMDAVAPATATDIAAPTSMTLEDAALTQAQQQAMLPAAQMEAAQVGTETLIAGQQGAIGDDALAKAAQVDRVAPIQAATVEIPEGALTERVVGTLSPNATAIAAQAAGTTLSRVTRAKKQLRNAGISEQAITDLGNDPEDLEDRLMDLTEQERGVIGDLPEEALVSNQIDSLLKGMENGEIPTWASPAVAAVEQMLAQRGLEASTVGRDNLFNAIIQSAVPIAQSNAQAIQQSVAQSREIESREELFNAQARQQTALQNASNVFQLNMAQFSADQQTALSNSKFLQTVGLTEADNRQQAAIQNAVLMSQANLAEADFYQKAQIQNAQAFLGMDMANLSNSQQATILSAQINQQSMLSNQAAQNAARQFNATSENQTQQFMAGLAQQVELTNTAAANSISQFNAQQANAAAATEFQVEADLNKAKAAMETDINKFNAQLAFNRKQWNAQNAQAVEQSNIAWRRQSNTVNNAALNQVAMQNAMNAFNLSGQSLAFLWQELRDKVTMDFQSAENLEDRKAQIYAQSLANEGASAANMADNITAIGTILTNMFEEADPTDLGSGVLTDK